MYTEAFAYNMMLKCTTEYSRLVGTKQYSRVPYDSAAADER